MAFIHIEISEPEGNAFALLGLANELALKEGRDPCPIQVRMQESDYEHLLQVLQEEFDGRIILTRRGKLIPRPA